MKVQAQEIQEGLQQFRGSVSIYGIPLIKTRYTEGIKYLVDAADCYWLIIDVSVIAKSLMDKSRFITIDLKRLEARKDDFAGPRLEVTYGDGNGNFFNRHRYCAAEFPLSELRLFFVTGTLMLPGEY